ncbi:NfeD family protein [Desulfoplanes formicivorans]|uniref:Serine protease n=1 Tax=Desulfoplanes formicivorans TaxID=1592317 RepID=A0A194AI81_9BACT|nr:nodulation protein NfeD [Desulfoplanes formicivorans]GAU08781.1 serine protease [Desulfoplanes formicivorans]
MVCQPFKLVLLVYLLAPFWCPGSLSAAPLPAVSCLYLQLETPLGPAQEELLANCLSQSQTMAADLVLIRLDTPGGLGTSMRSMVTSILNAPVPVAIWVGPAGARAASAGVFLVAASDYAAMAPQTSIGAASPVGMSGKEMPETMARKIQNDIISLLRGVVTARNRNMAWYEKAVTESASITAHEAVQHRVVEFLAPTVEDFLDQLGSRGIEQGEDTLLFDHTQVRMTSFEPGLKYKLLAWLLNPSIAYLLFLGGIAGLFFELSNPGAIFPGVFGTLCLLLGMYALSILPTTPAGVLLILLGLILFVIELKVVSYGLLTLAGMASLTIGSLILFDFEYGLTALPLRIIIASIAGIGALFVAVLLLVAKAHTRPKAMGLAALVGQSGEVLIWEKNRGQIKVRGERWSARTSVPYPLVPGDKVLVTRADGLVLDIDPASPPTQTV